MAGHRQSQDVEGSRPVWSLVESMQRLAILAALLAACRNAADSGGPGPAVTVADSVLLAEPDSIEEFLPLRTQAIALAGDLLLETGTAILHFDRAGHLLRIIGRPGNGPGEFVRISSLGLLSGDSLFAAVDARRARIIIFDLRDGALRREVTLTTPFYPDQQWVVSGDTVVMPGKLQRQPFTTWITTTDSIWHWGAAPPIYDSSLTAYSQGGEPSIAPHDSGWLALFPADPSLHLLSRHGTPLGRVTVPARRRLGVPPDVVDRVAAIAKADDFHFAASLVLANHRQSNGQYLLVHLDAETELNRNVNDPSSGGGTVAYSNVRYWVSLLSTDLTRACVDGLVPLNVDNILSPFFRGDTLYFVARRLDPTGRLRSMLYAYGVTDDGCRWIPTGGAQP
jgi:hypothetical protein